MSFYHSGDNGTKQIGNEYHPCLYLYGIYTVTIEEMQWEVLFELLVKGLYSPSSLCLLYTSPSPRDPTQSRF
ncbi:hypothetical protein, partial [Prevotella melaninogenica]|uniref:hypothetical protein n=1 Tax=Prevotella melaninogenica TaxID=28132 RepID=UPI001C5E65C1